MAIYTDTEGGLESIINNAKAAMEAAVLKLSSPADDDEIALINDSVAEINAISYLDDKQSLDNALEKVGNVFFLKNTL